MCNYRGLRVERFTSIPIAHLIQDRVLGVTVLVWLGALLSPRSLPSSIFMSCAYRQTLWFSARGNLVFKFARSATMQTRSFSVVGPKTWNGLPVDLRHLPNGVCSQFHHLLKTVLFRLANRSGAPLSGYLEGALYKVRLTDWLIDWVAVWKPGLIKTNIHTRI